MLRWLADHACRPPESIVLQAQIYAPGRKDRAMGKIIKMGQRRMDGLSRRRGVDVQDPRVVDSASLRDINS